VLDHIRRSVFLECRKPDLDMPLQFIEQVIEMDRFGQTTRRAD
jgi:hypothetical protein